MRKLGSWLARALPYLAIFLIASIWLSIAVPIVHRGWFPSYFWVILAVWILSIVFAVRTTPRVDSPSRSAYNFWRLMIVGTSAALVYLVAYPVFARPKEGGGRPRMSCLSNMKQLATAAHIYLADNDDVFPPAKSWYDGLHPILKRDLQCPDSDSKYAYGMNSAIGGAHADSISSPDRTVLFFEMDSVMPNAHGWARDAVARHEGFFYVAFVDGSAGYSTRTPLKWSR